MNLAKLEPILEHMFRHDTANTIFNDLKGHKNIVILQ